MSFFVPRVSGGGSTASWVVSVLSLLLSATAVGAAPPGPPDGVPGEAFARADSVTEVARAARGLGLGGRLHLEGVVLGSERVGLDLERFRVFAENGELVVHGEGGDETLAFGDHAYFRGPVIGEPGSLAVLTVLEDGRVRGVVRRQGGIWALAPGPERADGARELTGRRPSTEAGEVPDFRCGNDDLTAPDALTALQTQAESLVARAATAGGPESLAAATTTPYTVKVAIETDWELWQVLGGAAAIEEYVGDLIAFASSMYDAEIDTNLVVSHLSTWNSSSDPWNQSGSCILLQFGRYWNDNRAGVERTIAHFLSGRSLGFGVAWVGVLCEAAFNVNHGGSCPGLSPNVDNYGGAYGVTTTISGNFNPDSPNKVWDIIAVAHEIGHNFNSPHSHCYMNLGGSSQPVDECYNGQAGQTGCYAGTQSLPGPPGAGSGTIMSYCHFHAPGLTNIAFSFGTGHPYGVLPQRVPDRMRAHVESRAALAPACFTREEPGGGPTEPPCPDELLLTNGTVTGTDLEETCGVIYAGGTYTVGSSGDLTLRAFRVVLQDGFSVNNGGSLTVETQ